MTEQTAITTNQNQNQRSVFAYSDNDLRAARALKMMLPYGSKLTDDNAIALLLYGKLHDLDPLNGECYFLVREKADERTGETKREELGCYPGVKGKRKKARQQIEKNRGGSYKIEYAIVDPSTMGLDKTQYSVCIKAELRDTVSTGQYILDAIKLKHEGFDQSFIDAIVGKPPVVIGYGAVKVSEKYIKMTPAQLARKRAEVDCLTQRFDLPFADDISTDQVDYVDADYTEEKTNELQETTQQSEEPKLPRPAQIIMDELGFGSQN